MAKPKHVSTEDPKEGLMHEKVLSPASTDEQPPEEQGDEIQEKDKVKLHAAKEEKKKKKQWNILNSGWFPFFSFLLFSSLFNHLSHRLYQSGKLHDEYGE